MAAGGTHSSPFQRVMSENPAKKLTVFFFSFFSCAKSRFAAEWRMYG
jgi:hypothetical protein